MFYSDTNNVDIWYRYRLNENSDQDSVFLNGIFVYRYFKDYTVPLKELESFIRTKENPKGVVDFQEFERISRKVLNCSEENFYKVLEVKTKEFYSTLIRKEIYEYCKYYNINTINMPTNFLIEKIIDKQHDYYKICEELNLITKPEDIVGMVDLTPENNTNK